MVKAPDPGIPGDHVWRNCEKCGASVHVNRRETNMVLCTDCLPDTSAYTNFHTREGGCEPGPCAFHAPSRHHMVDWPVVIRWDRGGFQERTCEHGVGHPDPDYMTALRTRSKLTPEDVEVQEVHGCDGCCSSPLAPSEEEIQQRVEGLHQILKRLE